MRLTKFVVFTLAIAACAAGAHAQEGEEEPHFDIFIGRPMSGSQTLVGGALIDEVTPANNDLNLTERVFEADLATVDPPGFNSTYFATEPGFFNAGGPGAGLFGATNPAGALPLTPGESITVNLVSFEYWDGAGPVSFGAAPADLIITPIGDMASNEAPIGSIDDHPLFTIDDPLSDDLPAGGIYLATITAQLPGLDASDELSVLLVTGEEFEPAVELAEEFLSVPEPASALLLLLGAVAGVARKRS